MKINSQANEYWQRQWLRPDLTDEVTYALTLTGGTHTVPGLVTIQALDVNGVALARQSNLLVRLTTGVFPYAASTNGTLTNLINGTTLVEDLHTLVSGYTQNTALKLQSNTAGLWSFSVTNGTENQPMGLVIAPCEGALRGDFTTAGLGYGQVVSIAVTAAGSAYNTTGLAPYAPVVTLSAPPAGGIQATAVATVGTAGAAAGTITGITVTNPGYGYVTAPTVTIAASASGSGSTGTGATATASITFQYTT